MKIKSATIGIDIGATKIVAGFVSKNRKIIKKLKIKTRADKNKITDDLVFLIKKLDPRNKVKKIGVGIAGQVDIKSGRLIFSPNMKRLKNFELVNFLKNKLKKTINIKVDNDANCFAWGEYIFGAGKKYKNMVGLTLGTGIGCGIVIDGKLYHGKSFASEAGHIIVDPYKNKCTCGIKGVLEAYSSGKAIEKKYKKITGKNKTAKEIRKYALKDKKSFDYKICKEAGKYLGIGFASIINMLDPEIIVVGGSIAKSNLILNTAKKESKKYIFYKNYKPNIVKSKLGEDAGILGAALIAQ
ncbi:MAG: ROK family protein [Candidatus Omnitrophica bacterium]|nr:ROK family protein [Candidatus Omnitrophota bacterium]